MGKSIAGSVGAGGLNLANDVITVQFLLDCVPFVEGGPADELVIDAIVGPLTIGAINRFQRTRLGFADGRVDPEIRGGKTIVELNRFDPTPDVPLPPAPNPATPQSPGGGKGKGKGHGKKVSSPGKLPPGFPFGKKVTGKKG